jgi:hypothetical protein
MLSFYERDNMSLRLETSHDETTDEYVATLYHPNGDQEVKSVPNPRAVSTMATGVRAGPCRRTMDPSAIARRLAGHMAGQAAADVSMVPLRLEMETVRPTVGTAAYSETRRN